MDVLDHSPQRWSLLADGDQLYLDANVHEGAVGLSVLIALEAGEVRELQEKGVDFLDALSDDIQRSAPFARGSASRYRSRDLSASLEVEVAEAVDRWRQRADHESTD